VSLVELAGASSTTTTTEGFVYDGGNVACDLDGEGQVVRKYVYANGKHVALLAKNGTAWNTYYYYCDYLGSPRLMTDATGAVTWKQDYSAFGGDLGTPSTGNTHKFTGHLQDAATGQYYAKARYFTTQLGRWSQPEPLLRGVPGKKFLANPQMLNPYVYCLNNPTQNIDPNGLILENIWNDKNDLSNHLERAVSYKDFVDYAKNKTLEDMQFESGGLSTPSRAGGPYVRYVIDPANNSNVIDMRHFLVVGPQGDFGGLIGELAQLCIPDKYGGDKASAFDSQDFLSNKLGSDFYKKYYQKYKSSLSFSQIIEKFFKDRENNSKSKNSIPGKVVYYDMLRDKCLVK